MRVAIIGGGIGGMTTALLLSKRGVDVTIFEKEDHLGGRLSFVEEDGFRVDKGPTIVLLPEMIKEILSEAGVDSSSYELIKCDPLYRIHYPNGTDYIKYADPKQQIKEIQEKFPRDVDGFIQFMKDMDVRFKLGKKKILEKSFIRQSDFWNKETIQTLVKLKAYKNVFKQLSQYFNDERLMISYALQTLYIGGNPLSTPAIYSLVSYSEHEHGIYYIKGGYASIVQVLEKELRKRNVTIRLNSRVENIETRGFKAEHINVDGKKESFDQFVLNGDFPIAEKQLLQREQNYTPSSGCLLLYFGLDKIYEDQLPHQFFIGENFVDSMKDIFERKQIPTHPSYYTFNPTVIDTTLAPSNQSVLYVLVPVPSGSHINWSVQGRLLAERVINHMEENGFKQIRKHIKWQKIRTPGDAIYEGLFSGGSFGIAPTLFQSGVFRPQLKPFKEDNIFAVGASVHPGGGVPIVMQGAKLLADYLLREDIHNTEREEVSYVGSNSKGI
ncbi:phytoene desaturase family protein [Bacillus sp. 31A1R]|uniref:Phytoene desaturase family protein n=1 Tax=Robertmurraya mangrovi TaxID=3098077 RepID=A0ABU5IT03_9BACI|nr:phytoene desaturase family protein [Bacillus sp. 31A1R]MDZ5470290.1 phytoene desaturase family protein [Bacillus sp. 31A1R]